MAIRLETMKGGLSDWWKRRYSEQSIYLTEQTNQPTNNCFCNSSIWEF